MKKFLVGVILLVGISLLSKAIGFAGKVCRTCYVI